MNNEKKCELIIFGLNNMATEIFETAKEYYPKKFSKIRLVYFNDKFIKEQKLSDKINKKKYTIYYIIGFGGTNRKSCLDFMKKYKNFVPFTIIHPSAVIAKSAKIGKGCFIHPNTTISTNANIGNHCVINYNASIGHDSIIFDNVLVQPGARVSGNCKIGRDTLIGSNSFIFQKITIGKGCLIDALTYIHDDLPDEMIVSTRHIKPIKRNSLLKNKIPIW
ncbi:MAG: acetyltransferase [Candidatus Margulisiibacteriota bacterium]|jgi:sugar O-acyltransferase (sialic acid O-acetyltransferase NeuD family)